MEAKKTARQNGDPEGSVDFETKLQTELHKALARSIPAGTMQGEAPHAEIIRGLGLLAATFAVQTNVGERSFTEGMASYHQGICKALDVIIHEEPPEEEPRIIMP